MTTPSMGMYWWDDALEVATCNAVLTGKRQRVYWSDGKWRIGAAIIRSEARS